LYFHIADKNLQINTVHIDLIVVVIPRTALYVPIDVFFCQVIKQEFCFLHHSEVFGKVRNSLHVINNLIDVGKK